MKITLLVVLLVILVIGITNGCLTGCSNSEKPKKTKKPQEIKKPEEIENDEEDDVIILNVPGKIVASAYKCKTEVYLES